MKLDAITTTRLAELSKLKKNAVDIEDYIEAKAIKLIEVEFHDLVSQLADIEHRKAAAVEAEDYDVALELKLKGNNLRDNIKNKV